MKLEQNIKVPALASALLCLCLGDIKAQVAGERGVSEAQQAIESGIEPPIPHLTGTEILCEIATPNYQGIFALNPLAAVRRLTPLVVNAQSPKWAPDKTVFSFIRAGSVWVGDREGHIREIALVPRYTSEFRVEWDTSGRMYALYRMPGWTRILARGTDIDESHARKQLKEGQRLGVRFREDIILKSEPDAGENREVEVEDPESKKIGSLQLAPQVLDTAGVAFSPDKEQFVMAFAEPQPKSSVGRISLFKNIHVKGSAASAKAEFDKLTDQGNFKPFYMRGLYPNVTYVKDLLSDTKIAPGSNLQWSSDGTSIAYSRLDPVSGDVWPYIVSVANPQANVPVQIPGHMPKKPDRTAKKSVEVLKWTPEGDLYLIEGTRDTIYKATKTGQSFTAKVLFGVNSSGYPVIRYPAFRGEWLAYNLSTDNECAIHLKNLKSDEDRYIRLPVSGRTFGSLNAMDW